MTDPERGAVNQSKVILVELNYRYEGSFNPVDFITGVVLIRRE